MEFRHEWKHELSPGDLPALRSRLRAVAAPDSHGLFLWYTGRKEGGGIMRILIVEDERLLADSIKALLESRGFTAPAQPPPCRCRAGQPRPVGSLPDPQPLL